jgi:hypothetical protein
MFSPVNFILFFIGSLLLSLIFSGFIKLLFVNKYSHIPLAGIMAFLLIPLFIFSIFYTKVCYSDEHVISLITKAV